MSTSISFIHIPNEVNVENPSSLQEFLERMLFERLEFIPEESYYIGKTLDSGDDLQMVVYKVSCKDKMLFTRVTSDTHSGKALSAFATMT